MNNVYGGLILGSEKFIRQTLDHLDRDLFEDEEIAHRKVLQPTVGQADILNVVAEFFGCVADEPIFRCNRKARNFAIYLLKHQAGMTNREVSHILGDTSSAAVVKVYQRLSKYLKLDDKWRKELERVKVEMSIVQV